MRVGGIGAGASNKLILPSQLQDPLLAESKAGSPHAIGRERVRHREADFCGDAGVDVQGLVTVGVLQEVLLEGKEIVAVEEQRLGCGFVLDFADPRRICERV